MFDLDLKRKPKKNPNFAEPKIQAKADLDLAKQIVTEVVSRNHQAYLHDSSLPQQTLSPQTAKSKTKKIFSRISWKNLILVPFTIIVLITGTMIGSRFINFAKSVSLSREDTFAAVRNELGAALGNKIPLLKSLDQSGIAQAIRGKSRVNILLLGYGGDGHQGGSLTDSIVVLSFNFANNQAAFIAVPRDTWLKVNGNYGKINSAYEFGGVNLSKQLVSEVLGVPIDYYLAMDFEGFRSVVNALGGVELNVDNTFTDYSYPTGDDSTDAPWCVTSDLSGFIPANSSDIGTTSFSPAPINLQQANCRYKKVHFDAGLQYMNGDLALEYARSRHAAGIEGSDFARSKRQQKLLLAIEKKVLSAGAIPKTFQIMDAIQGHFKTDLSVAEIKDLESFVAEIDLNKAPYFSIIDNGLLVAQTSTDGQYILVPKQGLDNISEIQNYIYNSLINSSQASNNAKSAS